MNLTYQIRQLLIDTFQRFIENENAENFVIEFWCCAYKTCKNAGIYYSTTSIVRIQSHDNGS